MRIALILSSNLYAAPYVQYYTEILKELGVQYDIISWNRLGVDEVGVLPFNLKSSESKGAFGKLRDYIRYQKFVKSKLLEGNYDKVVVFTIQMTMMLFPFLKARYRNNYVFDIRDYSVALKYFRFRLVAAVKNAALVTISSNGFKQWLPKGREYVIRHNTQISRPVDMLVNIEGQTKRKIVTIGSLRDYEANRAMIESLADDPMFELDFVGTGPADHMLKKLVKNRGIKNVKFQGRYAKEDEPKFLKDAALISILIDDSINSMTCMANRFYLSLVHGIPMMVDSGTEQAAWVKKYDLGVVIEKNIGIEKQITQYLRSFDREIFNTGRKACLEIVQKDLNEFQSKFEKFALDS